MAVIPEAESPSLPLSDSVTLLEMHQHMIWKHTHCSQLAESTVVSRLPDNRTGNLRTAPGASDSINADAATTAETTTYTGAPIIAYTAVTPDPSQTTQSSVVQPNTAVTPETLAGPSNTTQSNAAPSNTALRSNGAEPPRRRSTRLAATKRPVEEHEEPPPRKLKWERPPTTSLIEPFMFEDPPREWGQPLVRGTFIYVNPLRDSLPEGAFNFENPSHNSGSTPFDRTFIFENPSRDLGRTTPQVTTGGGAAEVPSTPEPPRKRRATIENVAAQKIPAMEPRCRYVPGPRVCMATPLHGEDEDFPLKLAPLEMPLEMPPVKLASVKRPLSLSDEAEQPHSQS